MISFNQWYKHVGLLICTCLESTQLGQHRQLTSVRMVFSIIASTYSWGLYHKSNYEGLSSLEQKPFFFDELGYYFNKAGSVAIALYLRPKLQLLLSRLDFWRNFRLLLKRTFRLNWTKVNIHFGRWVTKCVWNGILLCILLINV